MDSVDETVEAERFFEDMAFVFNGDGELLGRGYLLEEERRFMTGRNSPSFVCFCER